MADRTTRRTLERGSGLLGAVLGVGMVLALIALAANVALGLWTRSSVDSVAYDAVRYVATAPQGVAPEVARRQALDRARAQLGSYGRRVDLRFESGDGGDLVVLRVRAPGVGLLPALVDGGPTVGALDRRIVMVREPS